MGNKVGQTLGILVLIVIGLVQCAQQNISVVNKETGETQTLLESWTNTLNPSAAAIPYMNEATEHYANQDYADAVNSFTQVIKVDPQSTQAYLGRAYSYQNFRQYEKAIEDFTQAVAIDPELAEAYAGRGRSYQETIQYQKAIEDFGHAIRIDPQFVDAYIDRGMTYFVSADNLEKVIADFNAAIEIDPNSVRAYTFRGMAYKEVGNHDQALKDYNVAIELEPGRAENYRERGQIYKQLGDFEKALDDYTKAINLRSDFGMAYQERGFVYLESERYDEAIQDFTEGMELLKKSPLEATLRYLSLFGRGIAYARQSEWGLAIKDLSDSIEVFDAFEFTYRERGYLYVQVEEYKKAMQDFEIYLSLAPNSLDKEEITNTMQMIAPYLD